MICKYIGVLNLDLMLQVRLIMLIVAIVSAFRHPDNPLDYSENSN